MKRSSICTRENATSLWHFFNKTVFDNELKEVPQFRFSKNLDITELDPTIEEYVEAVCDGLFEVCFDYNDDMFYQITLNYQAITERPQLMYETIIHEQIHQLQAERNLDVDHDEFFNQWVEKIKQQLNINVE